VRVYVEAAGCDRRRLDAESIRRYFKANDCVLVSDPAQADRILVVTCAFKQKEEEESVRRIRSLRRYGRDIVVYGCLADIAGGRYPEFDDLPSVAPREIDDLDRHFEGITVPFAAVRDANVVAHAGAAHVRLRRRIEAGMIPWRESLEWLRQPGPWRRRGAHAEAEDRFNLFVCRGCLGLCSYCAIKRAIGPVRSKPVADVVSEYLSGVEEGYRAFNVLGDDPGCYGLDISASLPELLMALFDASDPSQSSAGIGSGDARRVSFHIREIHPKHLIRHHKQMLELTQFSLVENILCPVQSGSDRVLGLMKREHSTSDLLRALRLIKECHPGLTLDTQIIVGFPTETDDDLEKTLDFVRDARFDSVVVFPYHDKVGTVASESEGKVPQAEIRRRIRRAFRYFRREHIRAYRSCP
jgi:threonylcarbamoyladenosine tRNA methylthiotransferase CDKAL1